MLTKNIVITAASLLLAAAAAQALNTQQVNVSGSAGHATIASAINAGVLSGDPNVRVEVIEAGTYGNLISVPSGITLTIIGTVPGVIADNGDGNAINLAAGGTDFNVTVENIRLQRGTGSGGVVDIDAGSGTTTVTFRDCEIAQTVGGGVGGEAVILDTRPAVVTGQITVNFDGCTISAISQTNNKAALRIRNNPVATPVDFNNLHMNLTDTDISSGDAGILWTSTTAGLSGVQFTMTGGSISAPVDRAFEFSEATNNCQFTFTDATLTAEEEVILVSETGDGNTWTFDRSTFDNSAGALGDHNVQVRYTSSLNPTTNRVYVHNSVFKSQGGAAVRTLFMTDVITEAFHNTFVSAGTTSGRAVSNQAQTAGNGALTVLKNNVFLNFPGETGDLIAGSTLGSTSNVIVGPSDDTSAGTTHTYISATAGLSNATTAAVVNAGFVPQIGSGLLNVGNTDPAIYAAIGGVDHDGNVRPNPTVDAPDAGAFEGTPVPAAVNSWQLLD